MVKKIKSFTIELKKNTISFIPEKVTQPWHREYLNRKRDGLLPDEIIQDMQRITRNLTEKNKEGKIVGKYNLFMSSLSPNPKSSQGRQKTSYRKLLISQLEKSRDDILKFKGKEILLYIIIYFRKERFETRDIDNYLKAIIDALKPFIGDDNKVVCIIAEKRKLGDYPDEDMDFLEQILIVITDPIAREDIMKN